MMARRRHPWCAWRPAGSWLAVVALALSGGGMGAAVAVASSVERPTGLAAADPVTDCTTTTGVVVAVDFASWGGQIEVGCDPTETTGVAAMEAAGFTPTGTSEYGLAFICLIDGQPANQSCTTPHRLRPAGPSGTPTLGHRVGPTARLEPRPLSLNPAASRPGFLGRPARATRFRSHPSGCAPPSPARTPPRPRSRRRPRRRRPRPVTTPGTGSSGSGAAVAAAPSTGPSSGGSARGGAPGGSTPSSTDSTPSSPGSPSTPHPGSTPTSTSVTGGGTMVTGSGTTGSQPAGAIDSHQSATPKIIAAVPASTQHHAPPGSPWPAVIAASVVAALAGGAGVIAWRRRRTA